MQLEPPSIFDLSYMHVHEQSSKAGINLTMHYINQ